MRTHVLIAIAALSLVAGFSAARAADERHSPDAHMDQNADRYTYDYDDGVCSYHYEYDFKSLKDKLDQKGDCRNVPIQRYRPQAAIAPAYPPPGAAPPVMAPGSAAVVPPPLPVPQAAPSVTIGSPEPGTPPNAPAGIAVTPLQ
ncbi:MAG TPA: hypothetical protein VGF92_13990 [Stellaceae bacterium]